MTYLTGLQGCMKTAIHTGPFSYEANYQGQTKIIKQILAYRSIYFFDFELTIRYQNSFMTQCSLMSILNNHIMITNTRCGFKCMNVNVKY